MERELKLYKFVDGVNDTPFPNPLSINEQIVITSFTYNAQRMAATPTITASVEYPRCLDNDWDINVYATFNGEKYYIRQIPSSSKSNTSVMYKHDITLYSERFILENIYFVNVDQKEDTSVYIRCDLMEFAEIINKSLESSNLLYRVEIDSSVSDTEKAKETKDITLENVYLSEAIQEIYNQWEIPFYFEGTKIVVKDCSENITDVTLAYGADESLLSIKKNNANFRKITRISGYGSDKNIPFYYPNWSQKGVIDVEPLGTNSKLTKDKITITDMKRFDKKMPLNGVVKYKDYTSVEPEPIDFNKMWSKTHIDGAVSNPIYNDYFNFTFYPPKLGRYVEIEIPVDEYHTFYLGSKRNISSSLIEVSYESFNEQELIDIAKDTMYSFSLNKDSSIVKSSGGNVHNVSIEQTTPSYSIAYTPIYRDTSGKNAYYWQMSAQKIYTLKINVLLPSSDSFTEEDVHKYICTFVSTLQTSFSVQNAEKYGTIVITDRQRNRVYKEDVIAKIDNYNIQIKLGNYYQLEISDLNVKYVVDSSFQGWYLNDKKKINLEDIGISINGTPDSTWNGEGFTQEVVSKIPTAQNLMPSLYRNSIGKRKFYNAINYPRTNVTGGVDKEIGEYTRQRNILNDNYISEDNEGFYSFETLWTKVNQNEHIQEFSEIYPSITNVTNANNDPIDEILEVWFDDNDNNEVDEEGKYIHPYFYVRIPQFNGNNGFNLFDHKIVGEEMQVAMTSGDCAACNFKIIVKTRVSEGNETYEDVINPIKTQDIMGKRVPISGNREEKTSGDFGSEDATQQDSRNNSIWLVLEKDNQTFNETYPNYAKGVYPKVGDKFVLLNIDMPQEYVLEAEDKLTKEIIRYMSQNNSDKWNFDIDFSRIFLQENVNFYERLDENCKLNVRYNGEIYNFYVNSYKYEVKANEALPKITVGLVDTITINRGITQNIVDSVMKAFNQMFEVVDGSQGTMNESYLRKNVPEVMPNNMVFNKNVTIGGELNADKINTTEITSKLYGGDEVMGTGFKLEEDANGNSTLTVDNVNVRKRLKATEFIIQQIQFQGGIVVQSAAAMECNKVEEVKYGDLVGRYECYFDTKNGSISNQFVAGDLARCQRVGYAPKYYWRKVVEVGSNYIVLSNVEGEYESNSDAPSEGDIIVQMGNTTDTNRQSAIEMNTTGENAPSFILYSGINSFSLVDKNVTGIVYNKETNEPQMYSYGSMFFGDRNLESNFITYQQKEGDDKKKLYINADVTFGSGSSGLSNLSEYQELKQSITNISVSGGDNLASLVKAQKAGFSFSKYTHNGDDNFWIFTTPLIFAESNNGNKDIFGLTYKENQQYTISGLFQCLTNNDGEDGDALEIVYTDNTYEYIVLSYYNILKEFSRTSRANKTIKLIRNGWKNGGTQILKVKIEEGASASDWTPSMEDVEQELKDYTNSTVGKNYAINNIIFDSYKQTVIDDRRVLKISEMKGNTNYVLSVESVTIGNYTTKPTQYTIRICDNLVYDDEQSTLHEFTFDIASSTKYIVFNSGTYGNKAKGVFLYSGTGNTLTFNKIKLAEGDTYAGWSAISAEEYESIRLLNNAIEGSTDITGGLILTNLIEMKDQSGDITAGINGLQSDANDIRFWAGNSWTNANIAPFRVYENGDVYGGSFYGLNNAFEINADNIFQVCDCDYTTQQDVPLFTFKFELTGSYIYIAKIGTITLPDGTSTSGIQFQIPQLPELTGTTIKIYNPNKYILLRYTETLLPYSQCNITNYTDTTIKTNISNFKDGIISSGSGDSAYYYNWSIIRNVAYVFRPNYCEMIAMPILVASDKIIPIELVKYKISGTLTINTSFKTITQSECVFMKWILTENYY